MASIGDLIMRVVAETKGFATQIVKDSEKAGDKAGKGFSARFAKASKAASGAKGGILQGLGLGVGLGVIGLATNAIGGLASAIGDATQAAIADEASQSRLRASLQANIPNWNGSTAAIEKNILAGQKKGFEDDAQRESIGLLVGAFHNEAKALSVLGTAQDLARFKGIDLKTASEALIKVEGGQFRALKALGIQLPKNATAEQALAAVQKVTAGQAEAYSKTLAGKLLANQIKFGEAVEDLGRNALPLLADGLELVNDLLDPTSISLEKLRKQAAEDIPGGNQKAIASLRRLGEAAQEMGISIEAAWELANEAGSQNVEDMKATQASLDAAFRASEKDISGITQAFTPLDDAIEENADTFKTWSAKVIESSGDVRRRLTDDMDALIDDVFDEQINRDRLSAQAAEMAAARRVLASATASAAEKRDARATLHSVEKDREQTLSALASHGDLSRKEIAKHLRELQHDYEHSTGAARKRIAALIAKWKELQSLQDHAVTLKVTTQLITENAAKPRGGHRALGGPVRAGVPYLVNERTRNSEIFVPSVSGRVEPSMASVATAPAVGYQDQSTTNINVGKADISTVHEIVWEQRRLAATRSMLPRALRR